MNLNLVPFLRLLLLAFSRSQSRSLRAATMSVEYGQEKGANANAKVESHSPSNSSDDIIQDGDTRYTMAVGMNSTNATYQDAAGAPVETDSPLGYSVSFWACMCLNINQMVGTGIFSTRELYLGS